MPLRHLLLTLMLFSATILVADIRGEEKAEPEQINLLVRRLGSAKFKDRESATQSLVRIGGPALTALKRAAATDPDVEVRRRAADLVARIENSLDRLLADYRSYGLPLPPARARLVSFEKEPRFICANGKEITGIQTFGLGFLLESAEKNTPAKVLHGTKTWFCEAKLVSPVFARDLPCGEELGKLLPRPSESLAIALQLHARGSTVAQTVLEMGFHGKCDSSPRTALRILAWAYWYQSLVDPTADHWPAACSHMKALIADEKELDTPEHQALLRSLEAALKPTTSKPGSVKRLVDDLINVRDNVLLDDERFARVFYLGFEAVPVLLEHLDDDRLTRYRGFRIGGEVVYPGDMPQDQYRVRQVVDTLLRDIAGETAFGDGQDPRVWWDKAKKEGEEAYLCARAVPPPDMEQPGNDTIWPVTGHIRLLGRKYPHRLSRIYREILEKRPDVMSCFVAREVCNSSLPRDKKVELFILAAKNKCLAHRRSALVELKTLDFERFVTLLVATLDNLPREFAAHYPNCFEPLFAELVCMTDDPRAWRALDRLARRSDPGLKMELLRSVEDSSPAAGERLRRLVFLASFLDDDALRDTRGKELVFRGGHAGSRFPRLEVCNYAAMLIATMISVKDKPDPDWDEKQWANLRDRMREAVKQEIARGRVGQS